MIDHDVYISATDLSTLVEMEHLKDHLSSLVPQDVRQTVLDNFETGYARKLASDLFEGKSIAAKIAPTALDGRGKKQSVA